MKTQYVLSASDKARRNRTGGAIPSAPETSPIDAIESRSILGVHDGMLPDDLMKILDGTSV